MGGIVYDIYVNDDKAKNPVYDERWDGTGVYEDDVESRQYGVVHVWSVRNTHLLGNNLINYLSKKLDSAGISNMSSIDDINAALLSLKDDIEYKVMSVPFTNKGIYSSLDDIFFTNVTEFVRILKFETTMKPAPLPDRSESEDWNDWIMCGNGVGFTISGYVGTAEPSPPETNGNYQRIRNVLLYSNDMQNVRLYVGAINSANGKRLQLIYVAPMGTKIRTRQQVDDYRFRNVYPYEPYINTTFPGGVNYTINSKFVTIDGIDYGYREETVDIALDNDFADYIAKSNLWDGNNGGWGYLFEGSNVYEMKTVKESHPYPSTNNAADIRNWLKEELNEGTEFENPPSNYYGDLCCWCGSRFNQIDSSTRTYTAEKLTNATEDIINIHIGDPPSHPDDYYTEDDPGDTTPDPDAPPDTGSGTLTTTYSMAKGTLRLIGQWIWSEGYQPLLKNSSPMENVIGLVSLPMVISGGTTENIVVGASDSKISGMKHDTTIIQIKSGALTIERAYNNFFDFEPFTNMQIYIPFCGFHPLSPSKIYGKPLSIKYSVDISDGSMCASLFAGGQLLDIYEGNCGVYLPLTATNYNDKRSAQLSAIMGTATSAVAGDVGGVVTSLFDLASISTHFSTKGALSSASGWSNPMLPFIIIDKPNYTIPAGYASQHGFRCEKTLTLSQCKGFTVVDEVSLSGLTCTDAEAKEIASLLSEGVYL